MANVNILTSDSINLRSDESGVFFINNISPGKYVLKFSHVGYETEPLELIVIIGDTLHLKISMRETPVNVDDITVLSNKQNVLNELSTPHHTLKGNELAESPKIGEDIYRAVTRVPGVSSNDFSATFKVRGGEHNQVLVLLDGLELYEPFHIKDIDGGILSIIDMDIVESIDLSTGAFSAAYGNHLSGVFNIKTKQPETDKKKLSASIDFLNARVLTSGTFSNNKNSWLASARRGYFEMITKLTDDYGDASPAFYDIFVKSSFEPRPNQSVTVNFLHAHDDFQYTDDEGSIDTSKSIYNNTYGWLTLNSLLWEKLLVRNIISFGIIDNKRNGSSFYEYSKDLYYDVKDSRRFGYYGFKQDHILNLSNFYSLHSGINFNFVEAEYDYISVQENRYQINPHDYRTYYDTLRYKSDVTGQTFGAYLSNQVRITPFIKTEIGIRYDRQSYIGDDYFSPRINTSVDIGNKTSLHCGWGYFYQSQKIYELAVPDGDTTFYPAERAEHYVIGLEKIFDNIQLSLEGYLKKTTNLRPDYRSLLFRTNLYPEANYDRIKLIFDNSRSKGLELSLKSDENKPLNWKAAYALSYVEEHLIQYTYDGIDVPVNEDIPGEYDQRHALFIDLSYQPSCNWKFSLSWEYHSGWPYSEQVKDDFWHYIVFGIFEGLYEQQLPAYHRMDLRFNRTFNTSKGRINIFLDIINLYDHDNLFAFDYNIVYKKDGNYYEKDPLYYLHFLPSFGISWIWEF
ncbi:MAG: TonB-dependent receptor plug domain-containing protein [candidate division Zixibacteria bacterium]|nr:TonB-dependent receptor plug domain-containing protein [candidate division Zixibacteria bacterium]